MFQAVPLGPKAGKLGALSNLFARPMLTRATRLLLPHTGEAPVGGGPYGDPGGRRPQLTLLWRSAGLPEFRTDKHSLKVPTSTSPRQPGGSAVSRSASPWLYSVPRGTLHYVKAMLSPASENSSSSQSNGTQWSPWLCPRAPRWAPTQVVSFGCGLRAPGFKAGALKMAKTWQTQGRTGAPLTAKTVGTEETAQRH
jgi:hypothetical protein